MFSLNQEVLLRSNIFYKGNPAEVATKTTQYRCTCNIYNTKVNRHNIQTPTTINTCISPSPRSL